jgi:hypothetical protein
VGLAIDGFCEHSKHTTLDEPGPHTAVDQSSLRPLHHERTQWARRRANHRGVAVDSVKRRLEAE